MTCTHDHASEGDPIVSLTVHLSPDGGTLHLVLTQCPDVDDKTMARIAHVMVEGLLPVRDEGGQR